MEDRLTQFTENILRLRSPDAGAFSAAGVFGTASPTAEALVPLKRQAVLFRTACLHGNQAVASRLAKDIEGLLLNAQLFDVVSEAESTKLIEELYTLAEGV